MLKIYDKIIWSDSKIVDFRVPWVIHNVVRESMEFINENRTKKM